jgi:hypothetical protein
MHGTAVKKKEKKRVIEIVSEERNVITDMYG